MDLDIPTIRRIIEGGQMSSGYAMNRLSGANKPSSTLTRWQVLFLQAAVDRNTGRPPKQPMPQHPGNVGSSPMTRETGDLTAVELAWLQRLPSDPTKVTFDDAVELGRLVRAVGKMEAPASTRLLESVWEPIRVHHDGIVARAEIQRLKDNPPRLPDYTREAVADAVSQRNPDAHPAGVGAEADAIANRMARDLQSKYERQLATAHRRADEADKAAAARAETQRIA